MIIQGSSLALAGASTKIRTTERHETLRAWVGDRRPDFEGREAASAPAPAARLSPSDLLSLTGLGSGAAAAGPKAGSDAKAKASAPDAPAAGSKEQVHILLVEKMIEMLTGRKVKIRPLELGKAPAEGAPAPPGDAPAADARPARAGYGIEYDATETRSEKESLEFRAAGVVRTADGREIRFDLSLAMSRESFEQSRVSFRAGDGVKVDPLVINFGGTAATLSDTKFAFDLDADGRAEDVSFAGQGSGFLAIDRDGTGKVADGRQLFGPATGDGFRELAAADDDGNGWIDGNDAVYKDLRIWTKDADGNDVLSTLADRKVGAIYLGNAAADFALKGDGGRENGEVRRTGVWLSEDGAAGTVQQVDLAV